MAKYNDLLALDNKLKTRQRHLQFLAIEIYKSTNTLNPIFLCEILCTYVNIFNFLVGFY